MPMNRQQLIEYIAERRAVAAERERNADTRTICGMCKVTHPTREAARVCYDSHARAPLKSAHLRDCSDDRM
jgi:hypothetical protein